MEATLVWLPHGAEVQRADPAVVSGRAEAARTALARWASTRGLRLVLPSSEPSAHLVVDMSGSDHVEAELAHAHDALSAEDPDAADRALARAEAILREHPENPSAAWQMAEVRRAWASRWSRLAPHDDERARLQWQAAAALDGGRAAGVGEHAAPRVPEADAVLAVQGEGEVTLDGRPAKDGPLRIAPGEHQLVARRHDAVVWADWVTFAPGAVVRVAIPQASPCSAEDVEHAAVRGGEFEASGVRCGDWVAVTSGSQAGRYRVAVCERDRCGTPFEWRSGLDPSIAAGAEPTVPVHSFPTWAKWTLVGAGAAAAAIATTIVLTGAFHAQPSSGGFVSGGLQITRFGLIGASSRSPVETSGR